MAPTVPLPRRPLDPDDPVRWWYENELGWAAVPGSPGSPVRLATGLRFDVLDVPAEAGFAALRHLGPASPVAVRGGRMRLLVAAGSAEELPGLLDWLEWGTLALDLRAIGAGGSIEAPRPPGLDTREGIHARVDAEGEPAGSLRVDRGRTGSLRADGGRTGLLRTDADRAGSLGAAVWLRPPEPGCEVEPTLPTLSALGGQAIGGGVGSAPDLVRLVATMATQCHRVRLRRACAQPLAFS
ncbi:SCO3374 family protein [Streptomyces sp. NPDC048415]|uniref:SCO3374 family protein n=1 Tax=Streptomyces sp. NPDC048415 TaxID=3154822 RepID=UPI0034203200